MSKYIKEIFDLRKKEYKELTRRYDEERILNALKYFDPFKEPIKTPLNFLKILYYIDTYGDFTEGKLIHQRIAQGWLKNQPAYIQIKTLQYIEDHNNGHER